MNNSNPPPELNKISLSEDLPVIQKPSLKKFVEDNLDFINRHLKQRGYTYLKLRQCLYQQHGVEININTLKKYTQQLNRAAKSKNRQASGLSVLQLPSSSNRSL